MNKRGSGILLAVTSLPSSYGIGDLGATAYRFVDFLADAGQCYWQILPLNPTSVSQGNSPYNSCSAFAGNHILISPDLLIEEGLLLKSDIKGDASFTDIKVDYRAVTEVKERILRIAYENFMNREETDYEFERFCNENAYWLDDYSLFVSLKENFEGVVWNDWPEDLRDRKKEALKDWKDRLMDRVMMEKFFQYIFFRQWVSLKKYCNSRDIKIIGDIPIYVIYDSSDVWANPELFKLDDEKLPLFVSGVPPDYFSKTGQFWGNPVYNWEVLKRTGYSWWLNRIGYNQKLYDVVRLDHFRGFIACWEIPAGEITAVKGKWVGAPAEGFFDTLLRSFPDLTVIAEDLGIITPDVREIMNTFGFPGMKLLIFAFGEDLPENPYITHNYNKNCVVYTGTHDNNTIKGWFRNELSYEDRKRLFRYLGHEVSEDTIHHELIRLAMMSVADTVIIPMQDILGLGEEARMNTPSTSKNNWEWMLAREQITSALAEELSEMTAIYGRAQKR